MAIRFDAAGEYLVSTAGLPVENTVSLCFWFYISTDTNAQVRIITIANGAGTLTNSIVLSATDGTTIALRTGATQQDGTNLSTGTWYHVGYTRDSSNVTTLYLNGVQDAQQTVANSFTTGVIAVSWPTGTQNINGRVFGFKMWDAVLSADEIAAEMWTTRPQRTANLNRWTPLMVGSNRYVDYSGNGRDWGVGGGTPTDEDDPPVSWGARVLVYPYAEPSVSVALTGVSSTTAVGNVSPTNTKALTGNSGTTAVGTVAPTNSRALTGNFATTSIGSVASSRTMGLLGLAATGAVGTVSVSSGNVTAALTGVGATSAVGSVSPALSLAVSNVAGSGGVGSVGVTRTTALTGAAATSAVGLLAPGLEFALTSVSGTSALGSVSGVLSIPITGIAGVSSVGSVTPETGTFVALTGVGASGAVGSVAGSFQLPLIGAAGTGQIGSVGAPAVVDVNVTGVQSTFYIGTVMVWGGTNDGQNPNWVVLNPTQTPSWVDVDDTQTPGWTPISP